MRTSLRTCLLLLAFAGSAFALTQGGTLSASASDCATAGACVVLNLQPQDGSAAVNLAGTFTGTVQFEATADGSTWLSITGTPVPTSTGATSATSAGLWQFNVAGLSRIRTRASALSAGKVTVRINSSTAKF